MGGCALIIFIIDALYCLAINADIIAWMLYRTFKAVILLLCKAFAAGLIGTGCMSAAHHNVALAAALICIITAILCGTL